MRTIKFRAWDKKTNKMVVGDEPFRGDDERNIAVQLDGTIVVESHEAYYPSICSHDYSNDDEAFAEQLVLMQFTGLLDKNGKEIYEGDIVKHFGEVSTIVYRAGAWCYEHPNGDAWGTIHGDILIGTEIMQWAEIIGNIYENPALITK